jgi:hypothetical protein
MNNQPVARFFKNAQLTLTKHSPEILIGLGIAGMWTATGLAVAATPKALRLIEEAKESEGVDKLPPIGVVKTTWKCYIPAAITATVSTACLIGASTKYVKRNAALAAAYKLSETALIEYRDKVVETIGEKKEKAVRDEIDKDRVEKNPVSKNEVIITEKGNTLCYDHLSGRYFNSDIEQIRRAANNLNREMTIGVGMYVSLNEFYDEIGLDHIPLGDELGWVVDKGLIDPDFSSHIADDGRPCIVLGFVTPPRRDFAKLV